MVNMGGADLIDDDIEWVGDGYSFHKVMRADIAHVAHNMREIDVREALLLKGCFPYEALCSCVENARWSLTMAVGRGMNAEPIAIFGVTSAAVIGDVGRPWLLATEAFGRKNARGIIENTKPMVAMMHAEFPVLQNWAHVDNTLAIRWLKWAGFELGDVVEMSGENFVEFHSAVDPRVCGVALNDGAQFAAEMI